MEQFLLEIAPVIIVAMLLYQKYRQTGVKDYLYCAGVIAVFYVLFLISENKLFIYACFFVLAILFYRIWKIGFE